MRRGPSRAGADVRRNADNNDGMFALRRPSCRCFTPCPPNVARPLGSRRSVNAETNVEKLGAGELAAGLGQLGEEGWELVGFEKGRFVFKRQK